MKQTTLRIEDDLYSQVAQRGEFAPTARRDLERYYTLLAYARKSLFETFTAAELSLMCDSCNGTLFEAWSMRLLSANIEDSILLDGIDKKWQVDAKALLEKLALINDAQTFALVDAMERFWEATARGENREIAKILEQ